MTKIVPDPDRTGDYTGLCCVVVTPPQGVSVYSLLEPQSGPWTAHLTFHARIDPEPR